MSDRIQFQSAGAVPPRTTRVIAPPVEATVLHHHEHLVAAFNTSKPNEIRYSADARDLEDRAAHVQASGNAFMAYLSEIVDDTAFNAESSVTDIRDVRAEALNAISDAVSDLVGVLSNAAEKWREDNGEF